MKVNPGLARRLENVRRHGMNWGRALRAQGKLPIEAPMVLPSPPPTVERPPDRDLQQTFFDDGLWIGYMEEPRNA